MVVTLSSPDPNDHERQVAQDCFKRGTAAMMNQNWEYACQMFRTAVELVPGNLLFRRSLRGVTERRYQDNGTGASMASMKLRTTKASIRECQMRGDWKSIAKLCESGLAINSWDHALHLDLGNALRSMGYEEVAVWCFQRAAELE